MLVIGIDPGTAETGLGLVQKTPTSYKLVYHACIKTNLTASPEKRLQHIFTQVNQAILDYQPQLLSMESLFFTSNAKSVMAVGQAMGAVMLAAAQNNIPVVKYSPPQIKRAVAGNGRAEKLQLQTAVRKHLHLKAIPRPQHAADALAAALCHLLQLTQTTERG